MPESSSSALKEKAEKDAGRRDGILRLYQIINALHMTALLMVVDAKMLVYLRSYKGDTARYAATNSKAMVALMASIMVTTPIMAAVSEAWGRKSLLWLGALWSLTLRLLDFALPVPATMFVTTAASAFQNATTLGLLTAIGDLFPGDPKGAGGATASMMTAATAAQIASPMIGAKLAAKNIRLPMAVGALLCGAEAGLLLMLPESLVESKRVPLSEVNWRSANPFVCLRLFFCGPRLATLSLVHMLSAATEPMTLNRTAILVHKESLDWDLQQCGRYVSATSVVSIPGFALGGRVLSTLGSSVAFLVGSAASFLHHGLDATWISESWQQFAITPLLMSRGVNTAALSALIFEAGEASGLRQGELRGYMQGLQVFANLLAQPLWAWWFGMCLKDQRPRRFFAGSAAMVLLQLALGQLAAVAMPLPKADKAPALAG